jgi:hypothetical protein
MGNLVPATNAQTFSKYLKKQTQISTNETPPKGQYELRSYPLAELVTSNMIDPAMHFDCTPPVSLGQSR